MLFISSYFTLCQKFTMNFESECYRGWCIWIPLMVDMYWCSDVITSASYNVEQSRVIFMVVYDIFLFENNVAVQNNLSVWLLTMSYSHVTLLRIPPKKLFSIYNTFWLACSSSPVPNVIFNRNYACSRIINDIGLIVSKTRKQECNSSTKIFVLILNM